MLRHLFWIFPAKSGLRQRSCPQLRSGQKHQSDQNSGHLPCPTEVKDMDSPHSRRGIPESSSGPFLLCHPSALFFSSNLGVLFVSSHQQTPEIYFFIHDEETRESSDLRQPIYLLFLLKGRSFACYGFFITYNPVWRDSVSHAPLLPSR